MGYLTDAVGAGREGYYTAATEAGEPPGVWYGAGAAELGLAGEVDADLMKAIYAHLVDPRDPAVADPQRWHEAATLGAPHKHYQSADELYAKALEAEPHAGPERRAELRMAAAEGSRQAVSFVDLTFSVPKSWTLAAVSFERAANEAREVGDVERATYWSALHQGVEDAIMAGARASIDHLQEHAGYSRVGHHGGGAGRWIDSHHWVVAQFLQHDSRNHDPQDHVHQGVLNKQLGADGKWRGLDTRAINRERPAAGAVGERVAEAKMLALGLALEVRPDGIAREIVGVDRAVMDHFSSRTQDKTVAQRELETVYRERYGREPSPRMSTILAQEAVLATRAAKSHTVEDLGARMDRWEAEASLEYAAGFAGMAEAIVAAGAAAAERERDTFDPAEITERAQALVTQARGTFTTADLTLAVSSALPADLGVPAEDVPELLEALTGTVWDATLAVDEKQDTRLMPPVLRLANGDSVYQAPRSQRHTTTGEIAANRLLREAAVLRGAPVWERDAAMERVTRFAESGVELNAGQVAALAGVLTSGAMLESLSAAPGTGKSFLTGAIGEAWASTGQRVMGMATTQAATEELAEVGLSALNVTRWLDAQTRLAEGRAREGDAEFVLRGGDLVVLDEASMTANRDLLTVWQRCEAIGAKLLVVGDPSQLTPVGPGGALTDIAEHGIAYELTEVMRFEAQWEREASLALRNGDPAAVAEYDKHGRLVDGGSLEQTEQTAARAWLADHLEGKDALLVAPTNEQANRVSAALRAELISLGKVAAEGVPLGIGNTSAGVGDVVQARRNGWELRGVEGNTAAPINRRAYEVTETRQDGSMIVAPVLARVGLDRELGAQIVLPASYVTKDLALGYASTPHAAEGRTVQRGHDILGPGSSAPGVLVGMTRATERNTAYAVTQRVAPGAETGETNAVQARSAAGVWLDLLTVAERERSALALTEQAARDAASTRTHGDQLIDGINTIRADRTSQIFDHLAVAGDLSEGDRQRLVADPAMRSLDAVLRTAELAGHDVAQVLGDAVRERELDTALSPAQALHWRVSTSLADQLAPKIDSYADLIPRDGVPQEWVEHLEAHAADADDRRRALGEQVAANGPQWAVETLGPVPTDPIQRLDWEHAAGTAAAVREQLGVTSETDPLGAAPRAGVPDKHALWRTAHTALGLPDTGKAQEAMSMGQLLVQIRMMERETAWAPPYVAEQLAAASLELEQTRVNAVLWEAKADTMTDPADQADLQAAAEQAKLREAELALMVPELEKQDHDRNVWWVHTAETRDRGERARAELGKRDVTLDDPKTQTKGDEWLTLWRAEQAHEDPVREIRDATEVTDPQLEADRANTDPGAPAGPVVETAIPDIRDIANAHVAEHSDTGRVTPSAETVRESVTRAGDAVAEINARAALDLRADEGARDRELASRADTDCSAQDHERHETLEV